MKRKAKKSNQCKAAQKKDINKEGEKGKNLKILLLAVYSLCKQSIITTSPETLIINLNAGDSAWMRSNNNSKKCIKLQLIANTMNVRNETEQKISIYIVHWNSVFERRYEYTEAHL